MCIRDRKKSMEELADGERLEIVATDAGFPRDAEAWCQTTGNRFVSVKSGAGKYEVIVEKSTPQSSSSEVCREDKGKTCILFSDDLDKVLATFVLANGEMCIRDSFLSEYIILLL